MSSKRKSKKLQEIGIEKDPEASSTESRSTIEPMVVRIVNAKRVYVRRLPEREVGNEIATVHEGETFEFLDIVGDYCEVRLSDGRIGYVAYEFCQEV